MTCQGAEQVSLRPIPALRSIPSWGHWEAEGLGAAFLLPAAGLVELALLPRVGLKSL